MEIDWWNYNGGNIFKGQFKGHIILVEIYSRGNVQSFYQKHKETGQSEKYTK